MEGETQLPSGVTARRDMMTTSTPVKSTALSKAIGPVLLMLALGTALMFVAGHAQSAALHDAAHDVRHATGFPCH